MRFPLRLAAAILVAAPAARGQAHDASHDPGATQNHWGAQAIVRVLRESPTIGGKPRTEGYLTQPSVMGQVTGWGGRLGLMGTVNFEGLTLERGELNVGALGEGYVDRRHPHTYLHELIASAASSRGTLRFSLSAGKGFAPFGTDDPMTRPFAAYPVNHHLAQVLERAVVIGALRHPRALVEVAAFNGDEPTGPDDWPNWSRFGDSWSARATLYPARTMELSASGARISSPENALGGAPAHYKYAASLRLDRGDPANRRTYALTEFARTDVGRSDSRPFHYTTALVEAELRRREGRIIIGLRAERTSRPEEERLSNRFRTVTPATDESINGITRWNIVTATVGTSFGWRGGIGAEPFIEAAWMRPEEVLTPTFFHPREFYGAAHIWSLSGGLRLRAGTPHRRMGRYGAAADHEMTGAHAH